MFITFTGEGVEGAKETEREEGEGRRVDSTLSLPRWRGVELGEIGLVIPFSGGFLIRIEEGKI